MGKDVKKLHFTNCTDNCKTIKNCFNMFEKPWTPNCSACKFEVPVLA